MVWGDLFCTARAFSGRCSLSSAFHNRVTLRVSRIGIARCTGALCHKSYELYHLPMGLSRSYLARPEVTSLSQAIGNRSKGCAGMTLATVLRTSSPASSREEG